MKIYKIETDTNNIQLLQPVDQSKINLDFMKFDCEPRLPEWEELLVYIYNPKIKPKNFYHFTSGVLVFDEKALEVCQTLFEMAGEILILQVEGGPKLYLLNVIECMNGLNPDKTEWDYYSDGTKGRILKLSLHKNRIMNESTIFKIPETCKNDIYCFADVKDKSDEFYHIYEENKLSGLIFKEIDSE